MSADFQYVRKQLMQKHQQIQVVTQTATIPIIRNRTMRHALFLGNAMREQNDFERSLMFVLMLILLIIFVITMAVVVYN
jgi:hypothetical protein